MDDHLEYKGDNMETSIRLARENDALLTKNAALQDRLGRIAELTYDAELESIDLTDVPVYIKQIRDIATEGE